ncbi:pentatricopeptide (PPR) repeat protein [Medicago truncatula]|uniref:Pentatricopeptide (PPR) repeat protein n=1 Tax=Medicago truncatula TaxID=3880 RepID=A0A072V1J9_MEDTR|nr:pentatricopeptide (PPR) repeat protein [Medicago truncatula]
MGYTKKAIESFVRMREFGVEPDAHMYNTILREMLNEKLLELALALYTTMLKSNVEPNFYTYNMLIDGICKRGEVKGAQELLDEMKRVGFPPSDMISCNVVLNGFCKTGRLKEALSFVWLIKKDGFSLNRNSYTSLINGFFKARRYREARVWYTKMFEEGIVPDVVLYAIMIRGLSEEGRVGEAGKMLEEMNQIGLTHDAYCYNVVIQGLCDVGMVVEAKELFNRMEKLGCELSIVTFNALINGLCKAKNLEEAMNLFYKMDVGRKYSFRFSLSQGSCQVSDGASLQKKVKEMCEAGQILKAYKLITDHAGDLRLDIISYNILINAFCLDREFNAAYNLFEELQKKGLSPDSVTYGTIIKGLFIVDREDDAFKKEQGLTGIHSLFGIFEEPS